jgi:hypothetical protein
MIIAAQTAKPFPKDVVFTELVEKLDPGNAHHPLFMSIPNRSE